MWTDARVLHCVDDDDAVVRLDLFDVTHALTPRSGLRLVCSERVPDLHVAVENGVLDLQASHPPAELLIQGALLRSVSAIRLNHREVSGAGPPAHALTVSRDEWTTPVCDLLSSTA